MAAAAPFPLATYLDWRDQNTTFEQLAAARSESVALSGNPPILVSGASISSNFFDTFRLQPELGRFFLAAEFRPGGDKVAILSHEIWQTHFGGDAGIVGKTIRLNGETYVVVGVAPADFEFFDRMDVWMPLALPSVGLEPANSRLAGGGTDETGRHCGQSTGRNADARRPRGPGIARNEQAMERPRAELLRGSGGPRRPPDDASPRHHGEFCPVHGVCECGQPASGSSLHARQGNRRPHRLGRQPLAGHAPTAGGDFLLCR